MIVGVQDMGDVAKKTMVYSSRTLAQLAGGKKEFGDKEEPPMVVGASPTISPRF